jgi:hypothetical protein
MPWKPISTSTRVALIVLTAGAICVMAFLHLILLECGGRSRPFERSAADLLLVGMVIAGAAILGQVAVWILSRWR